jgi:hypothetical protein
LLDLTVEKKGMLNGCSSYAGNTGEKLTTRLAAACDVSHGEKFESEGAEEGRGKVEAELWGACGL